MKDIYDNKINELNYNDEINECDLVDNDENYKLNNSNINMKNKVMRLFPYPDW